MSLFLFYERFDDLLWSSWGRVVMVLWKSVLFCQEYICVLLLLHAEKKKKPLIDPLLVNRI